MGEVPDSLPAAVDDSVMALDQQLCFALYAANRAVTGLYRPLLDKLGLTYPQYLVMLVLWEHARLGKETGVSFLGERLRLDSGTLTPLLKRLESQGLLTRRRGISDERRVSVELTETGLSLQESARGIPLEMLCRAGLARTETESLRAALQSVLVQLDAKQ